MGYQANGFNGGIYELNSPLRIFVLLLLITCVFFTLESVYFTIKHVGNKRFTKMMVVLIIFIFAHQMMTFALLFTHSPPIIDWIITTLGMYSMLFSTILQFEILYFFSPLTEFWTKRKIRAMEVFWVVVHFISYIEGYVQLGYLGEPIPDSYNRALFIYGYGISAFSIITTFSFTAVSLYIVNLVYKHFMISKQETLVQKVPQMKRFALTIAIESILDWFGIVLFASGFFITSDSRTFFTLGVCCMYFHCNVMAITFYQLKYISITQEENVPKKTIVFLKDLKKINATASLSSKVAEANTVKFYPQ